MCPFRQDGRVCQEVFGRGAESKRSSGVDGCEWECSAEQCLFMSCLSVSGCQESQVSVCVRKRERIMFTTV